MSERGRIGLIFGAIAVVAGGGLFYFLKVYQPKQLRTKAQAEIVAWEQRWTEARTCLLGATPASGKSSEALAVREMMPDPWNRGTCTKLIGKLARGVADDTGLMPVEHAWMTIDRAASKVATSFATHVDPFGESAAMRPKESPLPDALEALDAAHADLRKAAGMDPPAGAAQPPLPAAEVIAIKAGAADVTRIDAQLVPSAGGAVVFGEVKGVGGVEVLLVPGAAPKVGAVPPGAVRALPDLTWGAAGLREELAIGAIDDKGAFTSVTSLPQPDWTRVLATAGKPGEGLVAFGVTDKITFARATGGAPFTVTDKPIAALGVTAAEDVTGRALVAWNTADGALGGIIAKDGAPPKIVALGSGAVSTSCLTATHGWVGDNTQFIRFDDSGAAPHVMQGYELLGCSATSALLHKIDEGEFAVCGEACRTVTLTNLRFTRTAALAGEQVVAIRVNAGVLGVWRESGPPAFFSLGGAGVKLWPELVHSDGKVIDVIGSVGAVDAKAVIVRVPVPAGK